MAVMGAWLAPLKIRWGFGIDENTALILDKKSLSVKGENGVYVFDFKNVKRVEYNI